MFYTLSSSGETAVLGIDDDFVAGEEVGNGWIAVFGSREEALEFGGEDDPQGALRVVALDEAALRAEIAAAEGEGLLTVFYERGEPRVIRDEDVSSL